MNSEQSVQKPVAERKFDLEERTLIFAKKAINVSNAVVKNTINMELVSQLIRSAGSVGANYREANDSLTKKDFYYRINISRKEAKESKYWLELLLHANQGLEGEIKNLIDEASQLSRIFASIVLKNN